MCDACEEFEAIVKAGIDPEDTKSFEERLDAARKKYTDRLEVEALKSRMEAFNTGISDGSAFMQDMKDTIDELIEPSDNVAQASAEIQEVINILDVAQDYTLEALSLLYLGTDDIAELKGRVLDAFSDGRYTFLEAIYAMSALNEQYFVINEVKNKTDDLREQEDDK